jgi:hypothetical protein
VHGLIEPFYDRVGRDEQAVEPGHIYADQPIYLPPRHGVVISRLDPRDDRELGFKIGARTTQIFQHAPIKSLGLKSSEGFVAAKTKRDRPLIVLGGLRAQEPLAGSGRAQLLDAAICVPIYGADQFEEGFRRRVRAYEFENLFYLPAHASPRFDEGFVRLDHAQPVVHNQFAQHRGIRLSAAALEALLEWYVHFITGEISADSLIPEYRSEELARLAAEG